MKTMLKSYLIFLWLFSAALIGGFFYMASR